MENRNKKDYCMNHTKSLNLLDQAEVFVFLVVIELEDMSRQLYRKNGADDARLHPDVERGTSTTPSSAVGIAK